MTGNLSPPGPGEYTQIVNVEHLERVHPPDALRRIGQEIGDCQNNERLIGEIIF